MALRQYLPQKPYLPPIRVERKTPQPGILDYIAGLGQAYAQYQGQDLKFKQFEAQQARQAKLDERYDAKLALDAEALAHTRDRQATLDAARATTTGLQNKNLIQSMLISREKAEREKQLRELTSQYLPGDPRQVLSDEDAFGDDENIETEIQRDDNLLAQMIKSGASLDYISDLKALTGETATTPFVYHEDPKDTAAWEAMAGKRNVNAGKWATSMGANMDELLKQLQESIALPSDQFHESKLGRAITGQNWEMIDDNNAVDAYRKEQFDNFRMQLQDYLSDTSQAYQSGDPGIESQISKFLQSQLRDAGQASEEGFYGATSAPELANIMQGLRDMKLKGGTRLTPISELRDREEKRARLEHLLKKQ